MMNVETFCFQHCSVEFPHHKLMLPGHRSVSYTIYSTFMQNTDYRDSTESSAWHRSSCKVTKYWNILFLKLLSKTASLYIFLIINVEKILFPALPVLVVPSPQVKATRAPLCKLHYLLYAPGSRSKIDSVFLYHHSSINFVEYIVHRISPQKKKTISFMGETTFIP